ncbi:MAG: saccharopine dehydrogenase [Chitinophagaceae bacterium]|nr:MAG: saccharopine dehydrogenase [Chitinophagaceae bacterium]
MKEILLFGAGKSATVLIDYLLENAVSGQWRLTIVDADPELAKAKLGDSEHGEAIGFDISLPDKRAAAIRRADLVISMLPPVLHRLVAESCVEHARHLLTASYVDEHMRSLAGQLEEKGILFLCEMGLDPGIDHMSAMQLVDDIRRRGGTIHSFASHCGGLIAPESDDNPWHYKISWNPRNIVMAGSSGAVFRENGQTVSIPYHSLFEGSSVVDIPGMEPFGCYPNRDSLSYIALYGLEQTGSFLRTTLRHPDFMVAWNYVVKAGLTGEQPIHFPEGGLTYLQWLNSQLSKNMGLGSVDELLESIAVKNTRDTVANLFGWLGLTSDEMVPLSARSSADILQGMLESKLQLLPGDKDMIVMLHEFGYQLDGKAHRVQSSLVVKGTDNRHTAMAQTVGLPLGIAARLILEGTITMKGLRIPVYPEIYQPVLDELATRGVRFEERHS